jgi:hypothetical protein
VSIEVLLLALTTVVRPTSTAALVAMLSTRTPHRLLVAYLAAGLTFSLGVGAVVVLATRGLTVGTPSAAAARPVGDIVVGVAALAYAGAVWIGWLPRRRTPALDDSVNRSSRLRGRLADPSPSTAAVAGVVTHLPGLVYLAALNAIVATASGTVDGLVQVGIYNAIWFSLAIVALVLSVRRPSLPRTLLLAARDRIGPHQRGIVVVLVGAVGCYLLVAGIVAL